MNVGEARPSCYTFRFHLGYYLSLRFIPFEVPPCGYGGRRICPTTHCACCKRRLGSLGPPPQGEVVHICAPTPTPPPRLGTVDAEIEPPPPMLGAQGYQMFPISKTVVGPNIAVYAAPTYKAYTYLVSAFPAHSTSFSPNVSNPQRWNVHLYCNESEVLLVVGIHFISP